MRLRCVKCGVGRSDRAARAHRPGLPQVRLPRVRQAVQQLHRHRAEPGAASVRRHRAQGRLRRPSLRGIAYGDGVLAAASPTGRLIQSIHAQLRCWMMSPPASGPMTEGSPGSCRAPARCRGRPRGSARRDSRGLCSSAKAIKLCAGPRTKRPQAKAGRSAGCESIGVPSPLAPCSWLGPRECRLS